MQDSDEEVMVLVLAGGLGVDGGYVMSNSKPSMNMIGFFVLEMCGNTSESNNLAIDCGSWGCTFVKRSVKRSMNWNCGMDLRSTPSFFNPASYVLESLIKEMNTTPDLTLDLVDWPSFSRHVSYRALSIK
ncbi:hypothetical protein WICPIJ_009647 [Wickerhamomyces pijperi]|uniref:Uncharacterized protein n=1 Tax=Wickerhamomyces pijperi TaxID=599730 RepID=A0A9P8PMM1_WICPI|nr:hypothetical protein WICPIJ_009647 [Wickerhamomyces pijperi]